MYIKAYSKYMAYSGIFRTGDIFSPLQALYLGITQEQFMHILNLIQADLGILGTQAYIGTSFFTHMQVYAALLNMLLRNVLCKTINFQT